MMRSVLLILGASLVSVGCWGPKLEVTNNRVIPREHSNAVTPLGQERATIRIDYDSLYVADAATLPPSLRNDWFRFWPDGRVLRKSSCLNQPFEDASAINADNFDHGGFGFYSIVGHCLTIQFIGPAEDDLLFRTKYENYIGRVNLDGSFSLAKEETSPFWFLAAAHVERYERQSTPGMLRRPDW